MSQSSVPPSWESRELADVALVIQGQSPPGSSYNTEGSGLPFFQGKAEFGPMSPVAVKWCTAPSKVAAPGDVLISVRAPVGPTNLADTDCCIGRGLAAIRSYDPIPSRFLLYYLRHTVSALVEQSTGTTFEAISGDQLRAHRVNVAPLAEQRRIVEAIESYLTRLDDAVATLGRVQRNLKRYRASVLNAAVEARLVPTEAELARSEGRDYEHASVLLERILVERRRRWEADELAKMEAKGKVPKDDRWKAKYKEPVAPDTAHLPELPQGWCWASVDQLTSDVRYGSSAKTDPDLTSGVPVLRMGNIVDGVLSFEVLKYLPADHAEFPDLLLEPGDILFNRTNSAELVGKTAVFGGQTRPCSLASYLIRVRCLPGVGPEYVAQYINSLAGRIWVASVVTQQVGQANVNGTKLKACILPLPPWSEQRRIIADSERHLSLALQLDVEIQAAQRRLSRLRQSILKWAFEGRLVDQDPADEPASALLARIESERSAMTADKGTRRARKAAARRGA